MSRKKIKLSRFLRTLAHRQGATVRMLGAAAVREIRPLWRKHVVVPMITRALAHRQGRHDAFDDSVNLEPIMTWVVSNGNRIQTTQSRLQAAMGKGLGIKTREHSARVQKAIVIAKEDARALITNATKDFAKDLDDVLFDPENVGLRVEELRDLLLDRGNVSESRAELIARDQTYKTNAAVTRAHHEDAGFDRYVWSTSLDERVREEHAELEGEIFSYDSPSDEGNPGDPVNCRCVAVPYESDDTDDDSDDDDES